MPLFNYEVRDATGTVRTGTSEAENQEILTARLQQQGFQVQGVVKTRAQTPHKPRPLKRHHRIRPEDRLLFWLEFSLLLDQAVPLLRALEIAAEQTQSNKLQQALHLAMDHMSTGETLFAAVARHPDAFNAIEIGMIRIAEVGGALPDTVRRLVSYLEGDAQRRREQQWRLTQLTIFAVALVLLFLGVMRPGH
jgi:type IV pilus assembly protein PilC